MTKIETIKYIVEEEKGYLDELKLFIGEGNLKTLLQTGFIMRGKEYSNKDSWKATKFANDFVRVANKKISIFDKFRYFINSKI